MLYCSPPDTRAQMHTVTVLYNLRLLLHVMLPASKHTLAAHIYMHAFKPFAKELKGI